MNREEIMTLIPQRGNMLLLDEMHKEGEFSVASRTIRGDEFFLDGHFPGNPIVPGVILCEIMGQGCALALDDILDDTVTPMFAGMSNVRFRRQVVPGDTVVTRAKVAERKGSIYFFDSEATVNGKVCCSARLTIALVKKEK